MSLAEKSLQELAKMVFSEKYEVIENQQEEHTRKQHETVFDVPSHFAAAPLLSSFQAVRSSGCHAFLFLATPRRVDCQSGRKYVSCYQQIFDQP